MKISEVIKKSVNEREDHERQIGRYWSSELYAIIKGYLKPEDFFRKKEIDLTGCQMILVGEAMEAKLRELLEKQNIDFQAQVKRELKINNEITLVVQNDFEFPNFVIETKFPFSPIKNEIPARYAYQLEAEARASQKQVYLGVLSIPFDLRLIPYYPSKKRWEIIKRSLIKFHNALKLCQKT